MATQARSGAWHFAASLLCTLRVTPTQRARPRPRRMAENQLAESAEPYCNTTCDLAGPAMVSGEAGGATVRDRWRCPIRDVQLGATDFRCESSSHQFATGTSIASQLQLQRARYRGIVPYALLGAVGERTRYARRTGSAGHLRKGWQLAQLTAVGSWRSRSRWQARQVARSLRGAASCGAWQLAHVAWFATRWRPGSVGFAWQLSQPGGVARPSGP